MLPNNPFQAFSTLVIAILAASGVHAQSAQNNGDVNSNEARRTVPAPPMSVTSTDSEKIAETVTFEPAVLVTHLPGVYLQHPMPQTGSLSLRGQTGSRNMIRIDGIQYTNSLYGTFPNQYLSSTSALFASGVTLRKGPQSFFYANGNTGNVIDIALLNPDDKTAGVHGAGGLYYSSGTHTPGVAVNATTVRNTHAVSVGADYFSLGEIRSGSGDKLPFTTADQADWVAKVVLYPEDSPVVVTGGYMGHLTEDRTRTDQLGLGTLHRYSNQDNLVYINVGWKPFKVFQKVNIVASYHQMVERNERYNCAVTGMRDRVYLPGCQGLTQANNAQKTQDTVDTFGLDASSSLAIYKDRLFLLGNLEYYFDNVISSMDEARVPPERPGFLPQNRGLYSSGSYFSKFGTAIGTNANLLRTRLGDLWVQLGGRLSHFAGYAPIVPGIEEDIHYTDSGFTYTASVLWAYRDLLTVWGSFATGMRPPSLQESTAFGYVNGEYQIPRVDLEEEQSEQYEAGASLSLKHVQLGSVWFYHRIDNYIDEQPALWGSEIRLPDGTDIVERYNADDAVFKGIENSLALLIGDFSLFSTLTWQKGTVHHDTEGYMATLTNHVNLYPTRRTPRLFGTAGLQYRHPENRFHASIHMDWSDEQTRLHPLDERDLAICEAGVHSGNRKNNCKKFAGYYTFGISGGVQITPNADVLISLSNLLDRNYQTLGSTQPEPGFDARTMFRLHF
ncbi:MAG: TonB-dependent receptor [Deltaproteobacteria bacterium]|nr:TonB-dependent receptor [Deltaproteobacteria bacterium]